MAAPLSQVAGTSNWFETIAVSAVVSLFAGVALCLPVKIKQNWYRIFMILWLTMAGGELGRWCTEIWPDGTTSVGIGFVLLLLATIAGFKGKERAGHCVVMLAWIVGVLFAGILGAGLTDLSKNLSPLRVSNTLPKGTFLFLIPAAVGIAGVGKRKTTVLIPIIVELLTALLVFWTCMMISEGERGMWPFYEACKNLRLFGTVERFESLVSAAVSIGYFSMFALLLSTIGEITGQIREAWTKLGTVVGAATTAGILAVIDRSIEVLLLISGGVLMILLPILWETKNLRKSKKIPKST